MDILEYMLPDQVWQLTNHLAMPNDGQPIYTVVLGNQIWLLKDAKGFPWDMNTFDGNRVYQSVTEVNWVDPHQFKIFASKTWPGSNGGIAWAPRQFAAPAKPLVTADSSYRLYTDCSHFTPHDLGGPIVVQISGPYATDFLGDLGVQDAIAQYYMWGKDLTNLEINWYVKGFGLVQWELWVLVNGIYTQKQVSNFNMFKTGPLPQPMFPCGVPKII